MPPAAPDKPDHEITDPLAVKTDLERAEELFPNDPTAALAMARRALRGAPDDPARAKVLLFIARAERQEGRPLAAREQLLDAMELADRLRDREMVFEVLLLLARVERELGNLGDAADRVAQAVALSQDSADTASECDSLNLQAGVLSAQGKHVEALSSLERALDLARRLKLRDKEASVLSNLGNLRRQLGDYPGALDSLKAAYELMRESAPGGRNEAVNLINLGHLYRDMDESDSAREFFSRAREVGRESSDPMVEAASLNSLANVHSRSQEWTQATELYEEALAISRRMGLRQYEIDNLDGLGQVHAALGQHSEASKAHLAALAIAREAGDSEGEIDALLNLGRDYLAMDLPDAALAHLEEGLRLAEEQGRKRSLFEAHELLSQALQREGRFEESLRHHQEFYRAEKVVFNEESEERVKQLTVQFDVERAKHEAETYRMRTEVEQKAREQAEKMVRERTRELEEAQQEIVARLAIAGEYRDDGTGEHTRRVGRNAAAIARYLGWRNDEADLLYSAARLHDVGKIGIRDSILLKPGKLSDDEFDLMRAHTTIGGRILSGGNSKLLRLAEEISYAHHERWDGGGYPRGLKGEEIPMSARIVSVSDVLDALTHTRPYKDAWSVEDALDEIRKHSGAQFDPQVVEACMAVFGGEEGICPTDDVPATTITTAPAHRSAPKDSQRFGMPPVEQAE